MIRFRKGWHSYAFGVGRLTLWVRHRRDCDLPRVQLFVRVKGDPFA